MISTKIKSTSYVRNKTPKKKIVIGSTYNTGLNHINKLQQLKGNNSMDSPMFTVLRNGEIHSHYDIIYYSNFLGDLDVDKSIISISLENTGFITPNNGEYLDIFENIYTEKFYKKKWRQLEFWVSYTKEQLNSTIELCKTLIDKAGITPNVQTSNVVKDGISDFSGICYRANFNKKFLDLNPSWDFKHFKKEIEDENRKNYY